MAAEPRRHYGQRPYSAGDGARRHPLNGEPPPLLFRRSSSLERGIIGAPPPLVRDSDHRFTAAEVEALLAVRDKELLSVKRRLHRASKRNDALESTVTVLKEEGTGLRRTVREGTAKQDELQLRVSELEDVVKRKTIALKTSNHRRERVEDTAKAENAKARVAAEVARSALEEAGRKGSSLRERAQDAETQVKSLELQLEASEAQAVEAKRIAAGELAGRVSAHTRDRVALEAAVSAAEEDNRCLREKLAEAMEAVRQKQEAELQTDKVVRELQAWRERVASGDVVEMSSSEAKRLRWSEEQAELMKEANANLRSQLLESGKLLAEAEHSFQTVTAGYGDATGTIAGLGARLDQKHKGLLEAEKELRASKAEARRLKKCVTSLQLRLSEEQRRVRARERALDSTRRGMEALARGRQEETEARSREAEKRRAAERASANAAAEKESLRLRAEATEECAREMDAERRVLLQHLAAAREEAALLRSEKRGVFSPSTTREAPGPVKPETTSNDTIRVDNNTLGWRETIRSLLERAVSDWSVKSLFRPVSAPATDRKGCSKHTSSSRSSVEDSPSDSVPEAASGEAGLSKTSRGGDPPATKAAGRLMVAAVGHGSARSRRKRRNRSRESASPGDTTDVPRPLEVVRVYGAPEKEGSNRTAGWRWDLALPKCARENDSDGTGQILAALGLRTLGLSLRERGVRGEGARLALTAVARLLNALLLTRSLAAQQCAQVRTELALALGRLSARSSLVSNTRSAARRASTCNRTLLLRLVDLELRRWRECSATAAASENRAGVRANLDGEDKDAYHAYTNPDHINVSQSTDDDNETEGDDLDAMREANDRVSGVGRKQRLDLSPRKTGLDGEQRPQRPQAEMGAVLNLSNVGVDDDTLDRVVRKVLRTCTHGSHRHLRTSGEDCPTDEGSSKAKAVVSLARLLLRGNNITDAGALALVPLVKESPHVTELDLRDNAIGEKGKLALKKALKCNPWVHRVVSEELSDNPGERKGGGGLVLRGKRRQQSTATERARAYAFERIPPSSHASPSQPIALCSIGGKPKEREDTASAAYGRAPAYGGSADCLSPGNGETRTNGGDKMSLSLMQPSALESSTRTPPTFVAPSCIIDFRGCARRPLALPLVSGGSDSRDSSPTLTGGTSSRQDRGKGCRHRGSSTPSATPGRLDAEKTGGRTVHVTPNRVGDESTDLRGAVGASRRLRHTRYRKRADRDDGYPQPLTSEAQDEDGLEVLLSVSRRIFNKAEGFEQTRNHPRHPHTTSKSPVRTHNPGCVGPAEDCSEEVFSQPSEPRPPVTSRPPARSEGPNAPNSSPPSEGRDHSPPSQTRRGVRWRRAPRRRKWSPGAGGNRIETAPTAANVVGESSGLSRADDAHFFNEETWKEAQSDSVLEQSQEYSALEEKPAIDSKPALLDGDEALETRARDQQASPASGDLFRNNATSPQAPGEGDAVQLPPLARKPSASIVDPGVWDEPQQSSDTAGWAYDEATSSWYAADPAATAIESTGIGDGQVHADRGWRFDEQSATWYEDEPAWQEHDQHEPSYIEASANPAVTKEVLDDQGAPGENRVEHVGMPGDERIEATCEMLANQGVESETDETDEAGGLLAKRIKALELALRGRSDC